MRIAKPKRVNYELIDENTIPEPYQLMRTICSFEDHSHLTNSKVALAWHKALKADVDGHLVLGKCIKVTDLNKEFAAYDFIIVLNKKAWVEFDDTQKKALLDHELCHAEVVLNKYGEPKVDERGRVLYRLRKHDIEEFTAVVQRHGCYKRDLEKFVRALEKQKHPQLFEPPPKRANKEKRTAAEVN